MTDVQLTFLLQGQATHNSTLLLTAWLLAVVQVPFRLETSVLLTMD